MATVTKRKRRDGSYAYTAQIRIRIDGRPYSEAQTFDRRPLAEKWAKDREKALKSGAGLRGTSLGSLIDWYVEEFEGIANWGRAKAADLKRLKNHRLAEEDVLALTSQRLIQHVKERREKGAGPATALNDLIRISGVLKAARSVRGLNVDPTITKDAREACRRLRLVAKARQRDRLPTYDELQQLDEFFAHQDGSGRSEIQMRHIMWFAIYSARRQEEITRLLRADNDPSTKMGLVRDAKHPEGSKGNHRKFRYTEQAWQIMSMMPDGDRPFPVNPKSISARFTRACRILGIEDLRFHDLRHEATTRLFESGLTIPEVASYTLHDSWAVLKRYTHLGAARKIYDAPFLS